MCGIAGIFSKEPHDVKRLTNDVYEMISVLRHRGPDNEGVWIEQDGHLVLGHCRLSIIDLSSKGHQPMVSSCERYVISLNGEIYNYLELRKELEILGVKFRGNSDTEVLLEAISQWGIKKALDKVIGMFAFALWDRLEHKLFLVRDRVGKKPLFYTKINNSLYFASELKALKKLDKNLPIDYDSLNQYLTFGYIPAPKTIYENVFKVPSASYIVIHRKLNITPHLYWDICWDRKRNIKFDDAVSEVEELLKKAVKIRLRADVPIGCFLSGGIDSGLLTAFASIQTDKPLKTFTVSFKEKTFNENPLAKLVSQQYSTDHHVINLSPDLKDILPNVVKAYDEPFADPSAIPSYCISQEARKYVKVVLNGEGGDELFGGYRRYIAVRWYNKFKNFFELLPESFYRNLIAVIPQPKSFRSKYAFIHRFIRGITKNKYERYIVWCVDGFSELEKRYLYRNLDYNKYNSSVKFLREKFKDIEHINLLDHFMAIDFLLNMQNDMLVKMDIATMSHGLEGRNPFLDHRIIERAISLPCSIKISSFKTKPILRELSKRYLPREIVFAPKRGFEIPLIRWLQKDLFDLVYDTCLSSNGIIMDLFDKNYIKNLLLGKQRIDLDRWSKRVWILFILSMWEVINK